MSNDLRIAVLGVGMMGAFHVDALSKRVRGAKVTVVNDFLADKAAEVAGAVGARAEADPIAAINDPDVDAVLLASPGAAHAEQVNACLDRGIPVLCEKPLTTDIDSAYAIVQKEKALGKQLIQVGFMRRFDPEYVALRKLIADGGLGKPLMVHCIHRNPAVGDHFNSEFMIRDSVVHEVDSVRFLLDEEITSVEVIKGVATSSAPHGTHDPMLVIFETESGAIVTDEIFVRTGVAYEVRTEVVGEKGSAFIGLDQNLQLKSTDGRWGGKITPGFVERFGQAYDIELQRWVDAAKAGTIDGPSAWDGYAAVAVCEAGVLAVRSGAKVHVHLAGALRRHHQRPRNNTPGYRPPTWKERGREARTRPADVLLDQLGLRAARHRGQPRLRLDGAVAQGGLRPVLQVPAGRRRRRQETEEGRRATRASGIASVLPVLRWSGPDEDQRQAAVRAWKRVIQITVDLGVEVMNSEFNGTAGGAGDRRGAVPEVDGRAAADLRARRRRS